MKKHFVLLFLLVLAPLAAHAQNGCVNSPECPTMVLGLVGTLSFAVARLRGKGLPKR